MADGVSNAFLRLLDKSSEKLKERVEKLEKAMVGFRVWGLGFGFGVGFRVSALGLGCYKGNTRIDMMLILAIL